MECAESDGILVVSLVGRIDSANASEFSNELLAIAESRPELPMELDATELEYVSSAGLRAFRHAYMEMRQKHGVLAAKNVGRSVMEVLEITGFTRLFKFI